MPMWLTGQYSAMRSPGSRPEVTGVPTLGLVERHAGKADTGLAVGPHHQPRAIEGARSFGAPDVRRSLASQGGAQCPDPDGVADQVEGKSVNPSEA